MAITMMSDDGFGAMVNGKLMIRTVSTTPHQAAGNALVLVFGYDGRVVDWASPEAMLDTFAANAAAHPEARVKIVRVTAVTDGEEVSHAEALDGSIEPDLHPVREGVAVDGGGGAAPA